MLKKILLGGGLGIIGLAAVLVARTLMLPGAVDAMSETALTPVAGPSVDADAMAAALEKAAIISAGLARSGARWRPRKDRYRSQNRAAAASFR